MDVEPGAPGPAREGDGDGEGIGSFAVSAGLPPAGDSVGDFEGAKDGGADGARENGAGLGGATVVPKSMGGVFGLDTAVPMVGTEGDSERAFFKGNGVFSRTSSSSSSSSPL